MGGGWRAEGAQSNVMRAQRTFGPPTVREQGAALEPGRASAAGSGFNHGAFVVEQKGDSIKPDQREVK